MFQFHQRTLQMAVYNAFGEGIAYCMSPLNTECVSFTFTIGPMEIMPLSKPYEHKGLRDVKYLQLHHKQTLI